MRDYETINIAMTAAETGHLVFSTLHTLGAANAVDRIIDVFLANQQRQIIVQLASVLNAVVSSSFYRIKKGNSFRHLSLWRWIVRLKIWYGITRYIRLTVLSVRPVEKDVLDGFLHYKVIQRRKDNERDGDRLCNRSGIDGAKVGKIDKTIDV